MERDNYFSVAIASLRYNVDQIKKEGRESSPDWHLANGLLRLAEGILQEVLILEERLSGFERRLDPVDKGYPHDSTPIRPATEAIMIDSSPSSTTILLLVSDPLMKDVVLDALVSAGYHVITAADLGGAVGHLREIRPDLLITRPDISGVPGRTAADYLRTKLPGLPFLVISGFMDDDRVRDQNAIQDFYVFPKPFSRDELLHEVSRVLHTIRNR
jgi:CheY-like chemotaxis protein